MLRRTGARALPLLLVAGVGACAPAMQAGTAPTSEPVARADAAADPRVGLSPGWNDAGQAARNMELIAHRQRPAGFFDPQNMADFSLSNTDLAFRGNLAFVGSYHGWQVYDISNPSNPVLRTTLVCPGGQGDVSVLGNLLFMSVEETRGRVDCGAQGVSGAVSAERFRGVRIFDISNLDAPRQVAAVQTCRGSHTHTLVPDPRDPAVVYVYVSGTSVARSGQELAGCSPRQPSEDPNSSYFRIDVIRVPLAAPQEARIVSSPQVFADAQGNPAGLWRGGTHGPGTQTTSVTNQCHDITAFPEIGLAAGACAGNGILLDIRNPANPVRVAETADPNFAYWHSATFNNDGTKVIFTDEWGGGAAPRCRATDRPEWGANAIYRIVDRKLQPASYFKIPAAQTDAENCVAHNGSIVPVPGRDIMVQAWYQGGISVFDFTDAARPMEIAFFDRGPMSLTEQVIGGFWSAYWHNGHVFGTEIGRGFDVFRLSPSEYLTRNEIEAAGLARSETFNPQDQRKLSWPAAFVVSRAIVDGLQRNDVLADARLAEISQALDRAERLSGAERQAALTQLASSIDGYTQGSTDARRVRLLAASVRALATGGTVTE